MTNKLNQTDNVAVEELEQLLILAEETTAKIDYLGNILDRFRITTYFSMAVMYVLIGGSSYFMLKLSGYIGILAGIVGIIMICVFAYIIIGRVKRIKIFRREERAEMDIQMRLISLIDGQYRRVKSEGLISTITATTLEIRLRRLDRTDNSRT